MKKISAIFIMILAVSGVVSAEGKIKVSISGSMLVPSDSNYKNTYGNAVFFPEIKAGYKIFPETYFWVGYGYLYKEGQTPVLEADAKSTQHFLSLGVGYSNYIGEKIGYKMEVALMRASYTEEALGEEISDNTIGFRIDGGFSYSLTGNILAEISAGYLTASDTIQDVSIQLGGMKLSLGFVVVF
jgi:hypothetical protein